VPDPHPRHPDPCPSPCDSSDHCPACYGCLYHLPIADGPAVSAGTLTSIASEFSPRYQRHRDDLVSIDVRGLERLLGTPRTIAQELRREAADRGARVHVAVAGTRMAALVLALARPGVTVVDPGEEAAALATVPIDVLEKIDGGDPRALAVLLIVKQWGIRTLGELAALPAADLAARLGKQGLAWQAIARGVDLHPFVPDTPEERFESSLELEWPIEGLEPLSFVLTRLLEPLATRLERRDRGAAVFHVSLGLVTREVHARRLELPSPMRDVRTLRTLALLDLESHPPAAAVDRVTVVIDPTPGRVLQHTLFTRVLPTPDQLSTLLARLVALMGQDRVGAPATVDSYRPGAFDMKPFATDRDDHRGALREPRCEQGEATDSSLRPLVSVLRRCRQPVPARVAIEGGLPVRITTDRSGFAGGSVVSRAGPWRTSGHWWAGKALRRLDRREGNGPIASGVGLHRYSWNRDEWDVALTDGAVYRIFRDGDAGGWFIDAIVD
jgi:protein ImuB